MVTFVAQTPEQLGAVLRGYRQMRGLTQAELAARIGLAQKAISAAETHPRRMGVDRLYRILAALDVEMVFRDKKKRPPTVSEW